MCDNPISLRVLQYPPPRNNHEFTKVGFRRSIDTVLTIPLTSTEKYFSALLITLHGPIYGRRRGPERASRLM